MEKKQPLMKYGFAALMMASVLMDTLEKKAILTKQECDTILQASADRIEEIAIKLNNPELIGASEILHGTLGEVISLRKP